MKLESISKINVEDFVHCYRFITFQNGLKRLFIPVNIAICIVITVEILILSLFAFDPIVYILIFMEIIWVSTLLYIWYIMPKLLYKASAKLYYADNYYTWHDDHFTVTYTVEGIPSNSDIPYLNLLKGIEVKDYFYLFSTKNKIHIVPKGSFTEGSWNELSNILKVTLGDKYKIYLN